MENFPENNINENKMFLMSELEEKYKIGTAARKARLKALHIKPIRRGRKFVINAEQLCLMNELEAHLKAGGKTNEFVQQCIKSGKIVPPQEPEAETIVVRPEAQVVVTEELTIPSLEEQVEPYRAGYRPEDGKEKNTKRLTRLEQLQQLLMIYLKQPSRECLTWVAIAVLSAGATIVLPWSTVATGVGVFLVGQVSAAIGRSQKQPRQTGQLTEQSTLKPDATNRQDLNSTLTDKSLEAQIPPVMIGDANVHCYRNQERNRIIAILKADSSVLVVGREGMGKTTLVEAVVRHLTEEGFKVLQVEQATPKNMLKSMAEQLQISLKTMEGTSLTADGLRSVIKTHLMQLQRDEKVVLIIDNVHRGDPNFRDWLKTLKHYKVPMFLTATDPPRTDIFLNLPRIELSPLSEFAIRSIMEQEVMERGFNFTSHDLARLQERVGGNPMLAKKVVEEENSGVDAEAGDHARYLDMTPVIMLVGIVFVIMRTIALGTNDPVFYILAGSGGALFMGASYAMRAIPKDDKKIR